MAETRFRCSAAWGGRVWVVLLLAGWMVALLVGSGAADLVAYKEMAPGVHAQVTGGRMLHLYCQVPSGPAAQAFFAPLLKDPAGWSQYQKVRMAAIPYDQLSDQTKRRLLETVFPMDYADDSGWWHTVRFEGVEGTETWEALAGWLTGSSANASKARSAVENQGLNGTLSRGQRVFFPKALLLPTMRVPTPRPVVPEEPSRDTLNGIAGELEYGSDARGEYAVYTIKPGEAIYTSVVARFTDFRESADVLAASKAILERSNITNARRINAGQKIRIPVDMLSARYRPGDSESRQHFEEMRVESVRISAALPASRDLEGVVIVLDAGHGGRDHGASDYGSRLYEDELNYDVVCRIKALLEANTSARVYVTVKDLSQGFEPTNRSTFIHDKDEVLLTTPNYPNEDDARISAHLRWYLANDIYRKERAQGTPEDKMLFATIHCDALYYKLRGTMVYVPGARYRHAEYTPSGSVYAQYAESKGNQTIRISPSTFSRDEAMSLSFANVLIHSLRHHRVPIKIHDAGDPIRNAVRQSGGRAYNIAVLNYTLIPTKVLVEMANLNNSTDRQRLADPEWRQWYAEAFVEAVKQHFKAGQ